MQIQHRPFFSRINIFCLLSAAVASCVLVGCADSQPPSLNNSASSTHEKIMQQKPVIYQVFTRLYGNKNTTNKPWGTLDENGVGKFSDFTPDALASIKALGVSHIWYTGVPHHAIVGDYTHYGISMDDPDVVKGRAGSPYAVKDYYNVNPDLADDPANRLQEFDALIARTHEQGMKVIIDIVPNHVARRYTSLSAPDGVSDFGANDNTALTYARDNNFYYVEGEAFVVPIDANYKVLGGESHPLADGVFDEYPAKWTGNGARKAQPDINDWYETVKINYGVRPDGSLDFPQLPDDYADKSFDEHAIFWQDKTLPDSWYKFREIALYWLDRGVDGFRYDMAEMVPVEFWSFLNSEIKRKNPNALLLAEVYQPSKYREYIYKGKMDYLYDKVGFYDTLKTIMQGQGNVSDLVDIHNSVADIAPHMLHFLENHDEQRIASPDFAGSAEKGKPALAVSALISASPTLLYFGQDVGEDGSENMGFGRATRTTIFDYAGVPAHQRFMNGGKFDGGALFPDEKSLREFYENIMAIASTHPAVSGRYISLHALNKNTENYTEQQFAFARVNGKHRILVVANFSESPTGAFSLTLPSDLMNNVGASSITPLLPHENVIVDKNNNALTLSLDGLETKVFSF